MLALAALWLAVAPRPWSRRAVGVILAAGWLWCGLVFFLSHWAQLDFMAPVYGGAFLLQAALLLFAPTLRRRAFCARSEEHTSELQSLMRISYAVFCLKKKTDNKYQSLTLFYFATITYTIYIY